MKLTEITEKSYNEIPYTSNAYRITLPLRQKAVLSTLGFETPDLENARVLEIGCSFGGNILTFAMAFPNSECIGIDLSEIQINEGKKIVEKIGIKNLKLYAKNILEYNNEFGKFDYIVVHGVFSWVPNIVKEKILEVIRDGLVENGSAVISYNTYPGWKKQEIIRDLMRFRLEYLKERGIDIPENRLVSYANGTLEFLNLYGADDIYYKELAKQIQNNSSYYVRHEHLEENNDPLYLIDFEEMANKYNLSHICDSNLGLTFPIYTEEVVTSVESEARGNTVVKEQYYDYLANRQFRTSIITHTSNKPKINITREFRNEYLESLYVVADSIYLKNKKGIYFTNHVEYNSSYNKLLEYLNENYPNPIKISKISDDLKEFYSKVELYTKLLELILFRLLGISTLELKNPKLNINKIKLKETYRQYFKYRAETDKPLVNCGNVLGNILYLSKQESFSLTFFDGKRSLDELVKYLIDESNKKTLVNTDKKLNFDTLKKELEKLLVYCHNNYLLED